ncbi:hypothetical protein LRQ08_11980 [Rhodococcus qingshengii]|uniref:hypothetical protein n=1 Tax=Rhodococcus qingshengii TaxID=334542 RepID=UPI002111E849|nr:hypothetical protein [Rhodococcus qingshengii]UUE27520.1 hypothetical protein LRQ08_11980 [Rhodococcus qingshengii]
MVIYDEGLKPRVLIYSDTDDIDDLVGVVNQYAGTTANIRSFTPNIRWESWDALISIGYPHQSSDHLMTIQIGGAPLGGQVIRDVHGFPVEIRSMRLARSNGKEFRTDDDLVPSLKSIVKSELVPLIREWPVPRDAIDSPRFSDNDSYFAPLVSDLDGNAFAAIYRPDKRAGEVLYLPAGITDIRPWLLFAFERWAVENPEAFPSAPDWTAAVEWMTADEIDARDTWVAAVDTAQKARDAADRVEQESQNALRELREKADNAERILLTATGDALVQAVAAALTRLGFVVEDMDAKGGEKLEDLRVRDGDRIALCEVKGYTKGGSVTDLGKINRFVERYARDTGQWPDARWYVVNQFRDRDPSSRMQLLRGQDADVEGFAESDGLVIDTRSIFLLDKDVAGGVVTSDEARRLLRESTGRFTYGL